MLFYVCFPVSDLWILVRRVLSKDFISMGSYKAEDKLSHLSTLNL